MEIQAVKPIHSNQAESYLASVSPVKKVVVQPNIDNDKNCNNACCDIFENSYSPDLIEKKYDLACRLAAYYKNQYEKLSQNGCCVA